MLQIVTNDNYWDCECEKNYIHNKALKPFCYKCGTHHTEQPDSRQNEIKEEINGTV